VPRLPGRITTVRATGRRYDAAETSGRPFAGGLRQGQPSLLVTARQKVRTTLSSRSRTLVAAPVVSWDGRRCFMMLG
jgi:hypothetical protein